ncbi:GFA family protein [Chromobacterium sinusclupearum]|jgi:hypothetical protein|uniref:GFA family protein n=1 Tax=Chromobacterium sinusclupearum TaxID=2077146 RepID=UPI00267B317E
MVVGLTGGCLCGAVRYRLRGMPYHVTHCHCRSCRRASGAAFVTWFTVRVHELEWRGEKPVQYHSSAAVSRGFCPHCGSTLTYFHESDPEEIDVTAASLDSPEALVPEHHTWWEQRVEWGTASAQSSLPVHQRSGG